MGSSDNIDITNGNLAKNMNAIGHIDGEELLFLARSTIQQNLNRKREFFRRSTGHSKQLGAGLFVTLWILDHKYSSAKSSSSYALRGCIGHLKSNLPLKEFVQEVAVSAATRDPRFPPLSLEELSKTKIEIAILTPMHPISDLQQIEIGRDGLMIEGLGKRGLLLPKVATRLGWNPQSFLEGVCNKAGLPQNCWPGSCELFTFTTQIYREK